MVHRSISVGTLIVTSAILVSLQGRFNNTDEGRIPIRGAISLQVLNDQCRYLVPEDEARRGLLTDFLLNEYELAALNEGCILQAIAVAPNGMRLTDIPLILLRRAEGSLNFEQVGSPRRTNDIGTAVWRLQLTPHTWFAYQVVSPAPTKISVLSNQVEIGLCTGPQNEFSAPHPLDVGRGCAQRAP